LGKVTAHLGGRNGLGKTRLALYWENCLTGIGSPRARWFQQNGGLRKQGYGPVTRGLHGPGFKTRPDWQ